MEKIIERLIRREDLTADEVSEVAYSFANNDFNEAQGAAFLVLLRAKGETSVEISSMAKVLRAYIADTGYKSNPVPKNAVDIVGTGGDGFNTINISTSAAILTSACGVPVAKQGSTSASSKSGSSDVLTELGVEFLQPSAVRSCLEKCGICFMFAPMFHPALKNVFGIRKGLKVRTLFNIVGPLLNPLRPKRMLLGVYSKELLPIYAEACAKLGAEKALVVCGSGMDELNALGVIDAFEINNGVVSELKIDPQALGLPLSSAADLEGGSPQENAEMIKRIFAWDIAGDEKMLRKAESIALNAGAALYVSGEVDSIQKGLDKALSVLKSGSALKKLSEFAQITQDISAAAKPEP